MPNDESTPRRRRKKPSTETNTPPVEENKEPSKVEKFFAHLLAHLDQPLKDDTSVDQERLNALRLITKHLHDSGSSWKDVFDYAARGEQVSGGGGQNTQHIERENQTLKAALQVMKDEYARLKNDHEKTTANLNEYENGDEERDEEDEDEEDEEEIHSPVNRVLFAAEALAASFVAVGYCLTTDNPLLQAVPWSGLIAGGYILSIREHNRFGGIVVGWLLASLANSIIFSNIPSNHIEAMAKNVIATTFPLPQTGIVKEQIPFEIMEKFFAGKFVVKSHDIKATKVNGTTNYETCVSFDLEDFDKALVGTRVFVIKETDEKMCFPSDLSGKPLSLTMLAP